MEPPAYYSRLAETKTSSGGHLPHWSQRVATFVTFRLFDSLPQSKIQQWREERHLMSPCCSQDEEVATMDIDLQLKDPVQHWLDSGFGSCLLSSAENRKIVEEVICHFSDVRYSLYAYVVMSNHVHVLFRPMEGFDGISIVKSWKSFSAKRINQRMRRVGQVWQRESFDHLVRNAESFDRIRSYIRNNNPLLAFDYQELT